MGFMTEKNEPLKNKPKPLDLEEFSLFRILDKRGLIGFGGIIKNFSKLGGWVFIDELLRKEIKQRIKSAVQGLLQEIEKIKESLNESIKQAEREDDRCAKYDFWFALDIVEQIEEKIKKWFADVINKGGEECQSAEE